MASLYAIEAKTENQVFSALHFDAGKYANHKDQKWTYLLADRIKFDNAVQNAIRLKKPTGNVLLQWLEKIITGGQCSQLFVEQLDLNDLELMRIRHLCDQYGVVLVNLFTQPQYNNVIKGPWLS